MPVGHKVHPGAAEHVRLDVLALGPVPVADGQPRGEAGGHGDQPGRGGEVGGEELPDADAQVDRGGGHAGHEDDKLQAADKDLAQGSAAGGPSQLFLQPQHQVSEIATVGFFFFGDLPAAHMAIIFSTAFF